MANTAAAWTVRAEADTSWDAALWSEHGQTQRFLAFLRAVQLQPDESVLDYGCGTGRLCEFLPRTVRYAGLDSAAGMLERARAEHPERPFYAELPGLRFDHVVCIGTFNLAPAGEAWDTISRLWAQTARRTLTVSLYAGTDDSCTRFPAVEAAEQATKLASGWTLDCSYLPNDLLLVLRR